MAEIGCLKDGHFQNLQVENTTILGTNNLTLHTDKAFFGSVSAATTALVLNPDYPVIMRPFMSQIARNFGQGHFNVDTTELDNYLNNTLTPINMFPILVNHLASLCGGDSTSPTLATIHSVSLGLTTSAQLGPEDALVVGDQVTLLNNTTVGGKVATAVGNQADDVVALIIFGADNTLADGETFTLPFDAADGVAPDAFEVVDHDSVTGSPGAKKTAINGSGPILLTAAGTTTIRKGSFIFLKWITDNDIAVKACISTSQGAITTTCT